MCGIGGIYIRDPKVIKSHKGLELFVDTLHVGLEERGKQASGLVAVSRDGKVVFDKAAKPASEFIQDREDLPEDPWYIVLHTRYKTKGDVENHLNNHPIVYKSCFAVHNGTIRNDDQLFEKYKYKRHGEVDSEIIAAMMEDANFDLDKMKEAFKELEGPMATAVIDPKRHLGKLVLAKTEQSPLVFIDTGKFLVWASTYDAIKDAWGMVLGTPPKKKKFEEVHYRKMYVVTEDGIEKHDIPSKPYVYTAWPNRSESATPSARGGGTRTQTDGQTGQKGANGWERLPDGQWRDPHGKLHRSKVSTERIVARVTALREEGEGKARLMSEARMGTMGTNIWCRCETCSCMVSKNDIHDSIRGRICEDCRSAWFTILEEMADAAKKQEPATCDTPQPKNFGDSKDVFGGDVNILKGTGQTFTEKERHDFSTWAQDDEWVHRLVMREMEKATGFNEEALEFLMFRVPAKAVEENIRIRNFQKICLDEYDKMYTATWMEVSAEDFVAGLPILDFKQPKALPAGMKPERRMLDSLPQCGSNCAFCKKKAKRSISRGIEHIVFCAVHWDICHTRGCKNQAVHTSRTGVRYCHQHARSISGVYSDTILRTEGYVVGGPVT